MFKPDRSKAKPGDIIEFEQNGILVQGEVLPSKTKNSIVADISGTKGYEKLNHGYTNTVVSHKSYRIIGQANDALKVNHLGSVYG
ncbi:hypothetical protein GCM10007063_33070 [Lentibacillus kapialis]|uniref:DUF2187 domain-containing protein n=1 Tax=Lentibacillus kapialis TaxID=340214 RepID=A0A917Q2P6_9BACI|nr:DUF2187 family protein [Lentibacillus kapialis]GGK07946.1 hypothetical protein GCM10007063_33070 [Lentibacillus kapialis]